jgi:predicted site-specific integrase-resolvase
MQKLLTPSQLSERWSINVGTLRNWRSQGKGLPFLKLGTGKGSRVMYRIEDVENFENKHFKELNDGHTN